MRTSEKAPNDSTLARLPQYYAKADRLLDLLCVIPESELNAVARELFELVKQGKIKSLAGLMVRAGKGGTAMTKTRKGVRTMKEKHLAVAVAGALDRVAIPEMALIDAVEHATPTEIIDQLCPEYRETEESLQEKIGTIEFERENSELRDLIYNFLDLKALLIWRLSGPIFLRAAGLSDEQIARTCSAFGIGCAQGDRSKIV